MTAGDDLVRLLASAEDYGSLVDVLNLRILALGVRDSSY
jgi:hypothetical protein